TPLSLGIETLGGVNTKLIDRNASIPTQKSQIFSTAADSQTAVTIRVLQGERQMADDNVELGRFDLVGIPAARRGIPQIEVAFDIDANGIVHVSAKDLGTGKEQSIRITAPKKLSKEEIEEMVKNAEKFAAEDVKKKEEVEIINQADTLVYASEKSLKEFGDKISQSERADIEARINDLKAAMKDKNIDRIKKTMEDLTKSSHKLAEEIYKQAAAKQQAQQGAAGGAKQQESPKEEKSAAGGPTSGGKDEDIIDAEYKEEDEEK
ncbi:MAG: Hsp70 family protein, partial [Candidatus Omnitrophota bacterium]|nr:Hsp70 family protein [Candidatus Omnitrophota bacterium]